MPKQLHHVEATPLKAHPAYVAEREARLTQLAIETPDCTFIECTDCCYLERWDSGELRRTWQCPECDGALRTGRIYKGVIHA